MSKGTKQIRLGRVIRLLNQMEIILETLQEMQAENPTQWNLGRIHQLERNIEILKTEFQID